MQDFFFDKQSTRHLESMNLVRTNWRHSPVILEASDTTPWIVYYSPQCPKSFLSQKTLAKLSEDEETHGSADLPELVHAPWFFSRAWPFQVFGFLLLSNEIDQLPVIRYRTAWNDGTIPSWKDLNPREDWKEGKIYDWQSLPIPYGAVSHCAQ